MGEAVRDTVDRCERLIASLLMLARSEAAVGPGQRIDLAALAGDCITDLRARAHEAPVTVRDDLAPAWAQADPALAERLVANLLDNAIRHNVPGGWVEVTTATVGDRVELVVANGGERIDPDEAVRLAEPFRRRNRAVSGFGLGLSIVRSVAEAHGGTLTLAARAEGGLEVTAELPGAGAAPPGPAPPARRSELGARGAATDTLTRL